MSFHPVDKCANEVGCFFIIGIGTKLSTVLFENVAFAVTHVTAIHMPVLEMRGDCIDEVKWEKNPNYLDWFSEP